MTAKIGMMQGRLSPPEEGRFQSFPKNSWQQEIEHAQQAGISYIEWIYDEYGREVNPIETAEGIRKLNALKDEYKIATPALCADWLMDFPLLRCSPQQQQQREEELHALLKKAHSIGAWRIVLPFVDAASMRNELEKLEVLAILHRALSAAETYDVELHLETDLAPKDFARFLAEIPHPRVKVNYDSGNSSGLGYVPREEFAAYGSRIGSIHIKDRLRRPDGSVVSMPLGQGSADFDDLFTCLRSIGYQGGLTLQTARGTAGDEVAWIRSQAEFVRGYWS